jgi:peptidoglycan-associated lipoprotein
MKRVPSLIAFFSLFGMSSCAGPSSSAPAVAGTVPGALDPASTPTPAPAPRAEGATAASGADRPGAATLYFDYDAASIDAPSGDVLARYALYLREHPEVQVLIEGHADERGTVEYNLALGEKRARAAREYLQRLGVHTAQIRTTSFGEERPASSGSDETAWKKNRRDELSLK